MDEAAAEEETMPYMDLQGQVHSHLDGTILGRVSIVNEGQPNESLSLYCRRHGCKIMKRTRDAPDNARLLRWFKAGMCIPVGRDAALASRHKKLL